MPPRAKAKKVPGMAKETRKELKLLFQELNENPYKELNLAFFLISIIPILALAYILFDKIFIGNKVLDDIAPVLFFAGFIVLLGYTIGYRVTKNVIHKTLAYAVKAKRADELKSSFAMALVHDLKSPLAVLKANLSNLRTAFLGKLTKEEEEGISVCREVADRMNAIIIEIIDTYMIEARIAELKQSVFDLKDLIHEQCRELEAVAAEKRITFIADLCKGPLLLDADKEKIIRVLNNLLGNSVKYAPDGSRVVLRAYPVDTFARIEVLNTGTPIPAERLEKIFDKFERIDRTVEGQGLGLSIAKDIIELHQGKIWATSNAGEPNCFTVLLPLKKG
ncbi:MAG: HAMP domain-containing sensor histidine kinase [Candidatus Omnitrophica bacterium]|nr:HAMP domain-containing sensor histidine kinase [Candidatus Omnitrophota bacterium]